MRDIEDNISVLVENHFPQFYREQGNTFVNFVKEYFVWAEQTNNNIYFTRNLLEYRDIDKTIDTFLTHFEQKYLVNTPVDFDLSRFNIKKSKDFYSSKGTERGTKLLLNRVYGASDVELYFPSKDIIKASDGEWVVPVYLELSLSPKTASFQGKQVSGSFTGATAFVEGVSRKMINGKYIDVLSLSNVRGYFSYDEIITADGDLNDCPRVIGSLTEITIDDAGRNFAVGDVVDVISSRRGKQGKARINSVQASTGKVTFTLLDGGSGYRLETVPVIAEKMLVVSNKTFSNSYIPDFEIDETVYQPLANITFYSSNTSFELETVVVGSNSTANVAQGRVVGRQQKTIRGLASSNSTSNTVTGINTSFMEDVATNDYIKFQACTSTFQVSSVLSNTSLALTTFGPNVLANTVVSANGSMLLIVTSGNWFNADRIYNSSALVSSYSDLTASGLVVGVNASAIGLVSVVNTFTPNNYNFIYGGSSNVYANVNIVGTGSGATFQVGSLTDEEVVYLNTDRIGENNAITTVQLSGTVSANATSPQVNGVGTSFTTQLYKGAYFKFYGSSLVYQVNAISNNTILTLTTNGRAAVGNTYSITNGAYTTLPINALKYGFPKLPTANLSTIINNALTRDDYAIGTIASLTGINPGTGYNISPFVLTRDEDIAGFERRDLSVSISNTVGTFLVGEEITQDFSAPSYTLSTSGSNTSFIVNETITQVINTTANGYGQLISSNTSASVITVSGISNSSFGNSFVNSGFSSVLTGTVTSNTTSPQVNGVGTSFTSEISAGDYIKFSGNNLLFKVNSITNNTILSLTTNSALILSTNTIIKATNVAVGMTSGTFFFVNTAIANTQLSLSRGSVINVSPNLLSVKRKTFNQTFTGNVQITGSLSGATADVNSVTQIEDSALMGNNAVVNSFAGIVSGSVTGLSVIDSGFAYEDGELITLVKENSSYVATGFANLINQGIGEGYFKSTRGFLNSDKYIHDGDFYQFYSYQVKTSLPLNTYGETLKKLVHVAGTKLFGNVVKTSNVNVTITTSGVEIST